MSIVSSTYALDAAPQVDGRTYCTETHTDNVGIKHIVTYLAAIGTNYSAVMTARATQIAADLVAQDVARILNTDAPPTFVYATTSDLIAAYRAAFAESSQLWCGQLANWLLNRINEGTYTATQVENAFGLTSTQWTNTWLPKLQGYQSAYLAMIAAQGQ
jgi:hypothetical protein